jgi:TRAP-type C4-dicarboxylate transport system permease small subunit
MRKRMLYSFVAVGVFAVSWVGTAGATAAYDISGISSGFTDQVQAVLVVALPIAAGLIALVMGLRLFRKVAKA